MEIDIDIEILYYRYAGFMIIWIKLIYFLLELRYLTGKKIYIISPIVGLLRENLSFILSIGRERYIMVRLAL